MTQIHEGLGLDYQVDLLSRLIQTGPIYESSEGQSACVHELTNSLKNFGWDEVIVQHYTARQLANDPNFIPCHKFGDQYSGDMDRPKMNVIARMQASRPGKTLILNGHYDVEPVADTNQWERPWNSGYVDEERIWGRGAADMLGGLTSMLCVGSTLARDRDQWRGQIIFNAVADEEIGGNGSLASLHKLSSLGYLATKQEISCLIAEPSERVIALESLGFLHMTLRAEGRARHIGGGSGSKHINVLDDMISAISAFPDNLTDIKGSLGLSAADVNYVFGIIRGGSDAATPMSDIETQGTIFYPAEISVEKLKEAISSRISTDSVRPIFSGFNFDGHRSPPGDLSKAMESTRPSDSISFGIFPSPCDARLFEHFGVSNVVIYGPGSLSQAHAANEHIDIADIGVYNRHLEKAIRSYLA